jgi:hypothetical protein
MVNRNITLLRKNEILNSLKSMDRIFGTQYLGHTIPFSLYGPFDNKNNVIFRDTTDSLKTNQELKRNPRFERNLQEFYEKYDNKICLQSSSVCLKSPTVILMILLFLHIVYKLN